MTTRRRRESHLRLEALGHLSDHYSGVAGIGRESIAGPIDLYDGSQWELGSDSSGDSTDAVIFVKALPPPPSPQAKKRPGSESARLGSLDGQPGVSEHVGEDRVVPPPSPALAKKRYVVRAEASGPRDSFNTAQLIPAKSLRKTQHPVVLTPGLGSRRGYAGGGGGSSVVPGLPAAVKPMLREANEAQIARIDEQHLKTTPASPVGAVSEYKGDGVAVILPGREGRSGALYECRDQKSHKPRRDTICASGSPRESLSTHHGGGVREEDGDARGNHNMASSIHAPRPSRHGAHLTREAGFTRENKQLSSQAHSYRPPPGSRVSVDGVEFEVVSPLPPTSIPAPAPTPAPISTPAPTAGSASVLTPAPAIPAAAPNPPATGGRGRSQKQSAASTHPRPRSPSPAYGAWQSDHPRQRRPSFIERAQTRIHNSLHEQLVKAGRRPLPSFKVHSVTKTPSGHGGDRYEGKKQDLGRPPPLPPVTKEEWLARVEKLIRPTRAAEGDSASATPAEMNENGDWEALSSDSEDEDELFYAQKRPAWASGIPLSMHAPNSAPTPPIPERKKGMANLRNYTDVPNFSRPVVVEAPTPESYDYSSSTEPQMPLEAPLGGPKENLYKGGEDSRVASKKASDDSLFLGHETGGPRNPAGYSFFASDYAQKRVAADIERDEESRQQQKQRSSAQFSATPSRGDLVGKAESRRSWSPIPLSREQLDFAALPSALGDLWRPFPFDDRRGLPSQGRLQDAAGGCAVSQKKAVELE
ncbi:hypothetical protein F5B18DRAFT_558327 [Nemania serpens]|nr:hypothetical protein F5B18DRAFT_558327 [Nemania serpens]